MFISLAVPSLSQCPAVSGNRQTSPPMNHPGAGWESVDPSSATGRRTWKSPGPSRRPALPTAACLARWMLAVVGCTTKGKKHVAQPVENYKAGLFARIVSLFFETMAGRIYSIYSLYTLLTDSSHMPTKKKKNIFFPSYKILSPPLPITSICLCSSQRCSRAGRCSARSRLTWNEVFTVGTVQQGHLNISGQNIPIVGKENSSKIIIDPGLHETV